MSKISNKSLEKPLKALGDHQEFISRVKKTLYYGRLPRTDRLSLPLTELASEIFSESQRGHSLDRLHCNDAADISTNACVSPCSFVLAILYLERLKKLNPEYLEKTMPSDLFLVSLEADILRGAYVALATEVSTEPGMDAQPSSSSAEDDIGALGLSASQYNDDSFFALVSPFRPGAEMVSCKFLYDDGEPDEVFTDEWAASGGTTNKRLIQLEREFLDAINWDVYVNESTFWTKLTKIETTLAARQGTSRGGHYTYTEMLNLFGTLEIQSIIQRIGVISAILVASYMAALLTMVGSVILVSHIPGNSIQLRQQQPEQIKELETSRIVVPSLTYAKPVERSDESAKNDSVVLIENAEIASNTHMDMPVQSKNEFKTVNLLKTGIFLASIEGLLKPFCKCTCDNGDEKSANTTTNDVQCMTWDWWNVPTMQWLDDISKSAGKMFLAAANLDNFKYFLANHMANMKNFDLEDQIHKATKTRIQDQLERTWHKEWIDTIDEGLGRFSYYLQDVKS